MNIQPSDKLKNLPPYPFKEIDEAVNILREQGVTPIDFGVGDPSEPTPEFIRQSLNKSAEIHAETGYPSYIGSQRYREACAQYMKRRFNLDLDPNTEISSTIGSKEAVFHLPQALINQGDIVIIPSPGYPPMKTGTVFAGGVPFFVPLLEKNNYLVDFESIPQEIAEKAKIIWINYPSSPTGAVASREYYAKLIQWAHSNNIIIAADEGCYIDIYYHEPPVSILEVATEGIITFYSLSKRNNMTGYRSGFVAGDKNLIDIFKKFKTNIDSGTPNIIQEVSILALENDTHCKEMSALYEQKAQILVEALNKAGMKCEVPQATFYIWLKVPSNMTDVEFAKHLLSPNIGIVVTPGSLISDICFDGTNPGEGYVRFALMPTIEEIRTAAEIIGKLKI